MKKTGLADSPLFLKPAQPQAVAGATAQQPVEHERKHEREFVRNPERYGERSSERKPVRKSERPNTMRKSVNSMLPTPERRRSRRYSFQFYDDQIAAIKRLKRDAELAGHAVGLSDFVRQAIDEYLDKFKK